jgi:hypothetical protein
MGNLGIGFEDAGRAMGVFSPWPVPLSGIVDLPVEERDYELLKKRLKTERGLREFMFFERVAEASRTVLLIKVSVWSVVHV